MKPEKPKPDSATSQCFKRRLQRARSGDESAMGNLLQQYRDYLLLVANNESDPAIRNKVAPSDMVQESLMTAHQKFEQFEGDSEASMLAWLRQILVYDIYEAGRKFRTKKRSIDRERPLVFQSSMNIGIADCQDTPGTELLAEEEAVRLQTAMALLSNDQQKVIQLRNWHDLPFSEIGNAMDRTPEAVRKLWTRAIMNLQKLLNETT